MIGVRVIGLAVSGLVLTACGGAAPAVEDAGSPASESCGLSIGEMGEFVTVPAGTLSKGVDAIYPEERWQGEVAVEAFAIQTHEVTVAQFADFVAATDYVTDAERSVAEGRAGAGSAYFRLPEEGTEPGWELRADVSWRAPDGDVAGGSGQLPVVHVSRGDASAYAAWAGGRLPTEDEWEHAARLGSGELDRDDAGVVDDAGKAIGNAWQGIFPVANTVDDGFLGASPVGCFPADKIGLYDMLGNVWELTDTPYVDTDKVLTIKGGSFLCADNFCRRYRPAARQSQEYDFSTNHVGFRIVKDVAG